MLFSSVFMLLGIEITPIMVVSVLILMLIAMGVGYLIGNKPLSEDYYKEIDNLKNKNKIHTSVIDNVNLGIIAYNASGAIYSNQTIYDFPGFLASKESVPRDIYAFLDTYDQDNHLKANYMLNENNDDSVIRANYCHGRRIYEIKILHRFIGDDRLELVIVDDITQIKDDERRQRDLAANVSHELKTPLTVIRAFDTVISRVNRGENISHEELKKWGNRVVNNAVRMQDIVQDFLILSMCTQSVPMSVTNLRDVVKNALSSIVDYPGRSKVNIKVSINHDNPLVYGNDSLIMRIVINLLTNAIKYIDYTGKTVPHEISVRVNLTGDRFAIQVEDNGRGIPQDSIDHLFERFYRVDNSGNRDVGGTGIGLSIAKEIADMHDGSINVTSVSGAGSTFTLVLPSAECVYENVFDDAIAGIISDNAFYRSAAEYLAVQTAEAIKSMGYDDIIDSVDAFEKADKNDKIVWEKAVGEMFKAFGKDRYEELVEELTFADDFDEFDDEEVIEHEMNEPVEETEEPQIEGQLSIEEVNPEVISEAPNPAPVVEELSKEEARKLLTQPVVLRSATIRESENNSEITKETGISSAKSEKELYNSNNPVVSSAGGNSEDSIQSAVRKVLDDSAPLSGNND